jgi:hypothetical protein
MTLFQLHQEEMKRRQRNVSKLDNRAGEIGVVQGKVKLKSSMCLIKHYAMKAYGGVDV